VSYNNTINNKRKQIALHHPLPIPLSISYICADGDNIVDDK
jgi:hypothetical protein